ncbi:MGMT family protein [Nocardioides sp.]|uniref:MGMT family protein n=1 Tax=Nocardioides sp. TaxID=35761 RepID=UPI00321A73FA
MRADDDYIEAVLSLVERVPRGRVTTYGAIADVVGSGPRLVGNVMARHGGPVPWWRVVRADGSLPPSHHDEARARYLEEGTPLRRSGVSVDLTACFWQPRRVSGPDRAALLAAYDAQLRGRAEVAGASAWDTDGPLWRALYGDRALISYEDLSGHDVAELLTDTLAFLDDRPEVASAEWKTRGHDDLPGLHDLLVDAGFEPEEVETVMVGEAAALAVDVSLPDGVVVRRIDDDPDRERLLAQASVLQAEVFGRDGAGGESLLDRVERSAGTMEVWVAATEQGLVSAGRLEVVPGTDFAGLWGGATLPGWRGRGIYRALTAARAASAVERGVRWLQSDCTEMSRPILERSGLVGVTTTTPYVWTRP